jgi:hypothetical protein
MPLEVDQTVRVVGNDPLVPPHAPRDTRGASKCVRPILSVRHVVVHVEHDDMPNKLANQQPLSSMIGVKRELRRDWPCCNAAARPIAEVLILLSPGEVAGSSSRP